MSAPLVALAGYAGLTLLLVLTAVSTRVFAIIGGSDIPLNKFSPSGEDLPGFGQRVTRAHLNCVENLPVFAAVVAAAGFSGQFGIMEGTVMFILYARIAQSTIHLISSALPMVLIRGSLFSVQVILMFYYVVQMLF
ncbi:MAG: MAPEG family protein [Gammaproteobacteria bacterium]|nr:MAG: MAPEG family protein [Gammaproteobacteria bacterium]RLA52927.1 MAG: MAPEG family protein [Gammaproteobacteria bacterium]